MKPKNNDSATSLAKMQTAGSMSRPGGKRLCALLQPTPLATPTVDPQIAKLGTLERSAEALRFTLDRTEFWLSPEGLLREWVRRNLRLAAALAVPAILVAPIITLLLSKLQAWSAYAVEIAHHLAEIPKTLSSGMFVVGLGYLVLRWLMPR